MSLSARVALSALFLAVFLGACSDDEATTLSTTSSASATASASDAEVPGDTSTLGKTGTPIPPPQADSYHLETFASADYLGDAAAPAIELAVIPGTTDEAVIALQDGRIYRISLQESFEPQLWGDVSGLMPNANPGNLGEQGLLSVAFSPDFAEDGRVYLYYTRGRPAGSVLSRFEATLESLNVGSEELLIEIAQPAANHNGGHIAFDAAGYLLLSLGDGGGSGDPDGNGQNTGTLLGSVLRIDVSPANGYDIPADNPFGDEVYAFGFRNPWRMTVDMVTGEIWLGDVGQDTIEEVDRVVPGGNYGWNCFEGFSEYAGCSGDFIEPRTVYSHEFGQSVTGGFAYRGSRLPELYGWYVFADFYSGRIWAVNTADDSDAVQLTEADLNVASFTQLPDGELLIVSYVDGIFRLARN
jgi:glucose/arabinose dehydrogenase